MCSDRRRLRQLDQCEVLGSGRDAFVARQQTIVAIGSFVHTLPPSDRILLRLVTRGFRSFSISVWPCRGHVVCRMYPCGAAVREPHSTRHTREGAAELNIFLVWHADRRVVARPQGGEGF